MDRCVWVASIKKAICVLALNTKTVFLYFTVSHCRQMLDQSLSIHYHLAACVPPCARKMKKSGRCVLLAQSPAILHLTVAEEAGNKTASTIWNVLGTEELRSLLFGYTDAAQVGNVSWRGGLSFSIKQIIWLVWLAKNQLSRCLYNRWHPLHSAQSDPTRIHKKAKNKSFWDFSDVSVWL